MKVDLGALSKEAGFDFGEIMASSPSDPTQALHFLLGASRDVRDLGKEVIRGVATSHYRLTLDLRKAARQVPDSAQESYDTLLDMLESPLIPAEVWIDDEGRLRKMTFTETIASGPGAAEGDVTVEMTMEYYDFGVAVDVELPPESEVVDILEILQETPSA